MQIVRKCVKGDKTPYTLQLKIFLNNTIKLPKICLSPPPSCKSKKPSPPPPPLETCSWSPHKHSANFEISKHTGRVKIYFTDCMTLLNWKKNLTAYVIVTKFSCKHYPFFVHFLDKSTSFSHNIKIYWTCSYGGF